MDLCLNGNQAIHISVDLVGLEIAFSTKLVSVDFWVTGIALPPIERRPRGSQKLDPSRNGDKAFLKMTATNFAINRHEHLNSNRTNLGTAAKIDRHDAREDLGESIPR